MKRAHLGGAGTRAIATPAPTRGITVIVGLAWLGQFSGWLAAPLAAARATMPPCIWTLLIGLPDRVCRVGPRT
jgi:hypothetical protein